MQAQNHIRKIGAASLPVVACIVALLLAMLPIFGAASAFAEGEATGANDVGSMTGAASAADATTDNTTDEGTSVGGPGTSGILTIPVPEPYDDGTGNIVSDPSDSGEGAGGTALGLKFTTSYEVSFDANGGTFVSDAPTSFRAIHNTKLTDSTTAPAFTAAPEVTNADGEFVGWFYSGGDKDGQPFDVTAAITSATTIKAKWTAIHTVTFAANGGTPTPAAQKVLDGEHATQPTEVPAKAGAIFKGWAAEGQTDLFDFAGTPITSDLTIAAVWANSYPVTFDLAGGTGNFPTQNVEEGTCVVRPTSNPTLAGKDFWHWYAGDDPNTAYNFATPVTGPLTLHAAWVPKTYHITYDRSMYGSDGKLNVENPVFRYQADDDTFALDADVMKPTRENYRFVGWTVAVKPGEEGQLVTDGATTGTCVYVGSGSWGTLRLTAQWEQINDSEVVVPAPVEGPDGEMTSEPSDPDATVGTVLAVRTFDGENPPIDTLDIKFETHGGTPVESIPVPAQPNTPIPDDERDMPVTERTGYTFAGWYERWDDDAQQGVGQLIERLPEVYPVDGAVYHASWVPNTYTVEFYRDSAFADTAGLDGANESLVFSTAADTAITLPSHDATSDKPLGDAGRIFGYVLSGWRTTGQDGIAAHTYKANGSADASADAPTLAELIATIAGDEAGADIYDADMGHASEQRTIRLYAVWVPVYSVTVPVGTDKSVSMEIDVTREEVVRAVDDYYVESNTDRPVKLTAISDANRDVFDAIFALDGASDAAASYTDAAEAVKLKFINNSVLGIPTDEVVRLIPIDGTDEVDITDMPAGFGEPFRLGGMLTLDMDTDALLMQALDKDVTDTKLADLTFIVRDTEYETAGAWTFHGAAGTSQKWWTRIE